MVVQALFQVYKRSPFWLRNSLSRATGPLRTVLRPFNRIRMGAFDMYVDFADNASLKYLARKGGYEKLERAAFERCVVENSDPIVLDIGAHYGVYSLTAASARPGLKKKWIFGFEPDPTPYRNAVRSVAANGFTDSIEIVHAIVGDKAGSERLFINARSSADNRTHQVTSAEIDCKQVITLPTLTIDGFLQERGIPFDRNFVIKMDIQGNEPRALSGMKRVFGSAKGFAVFFEYCPYLIDSSGCSADEMIALLTSLEADTFFEFVDDRYIRLDGKDALISAFKRLRSCRETKMQGSCGDFLILRDMRFSPPNG